jgi:hypothetical protein
MLKKFEHFINIKKVSYSGIILDKISHYKLVNLFDIPKNWVIYAHHMTICLGELPIIYKNYINEEIELTVTHFGMNNSVLAVKVDGFFTLSRKGNEINNRKPHITIATSLSSSPKESNYIEDWVEITPFKIKGIVKEID